jgi:DNA-binding NarL/FixJ family response regulator
MMKIKVLIADDHSVVRNGLRVLIEGAADMQVCGEARNGEEAIRVAQKTNPDVVLLDIAMPVMDGLKTTEGLVKSTPTVRVLILSSFTGEECVRDAFCAGAAGYITKHSAAAELTEGIRKVQQGSSYLSPMLAKMFNGRLDDIMHGQQAPARRNDLTDNEKRLLKLIAERLANKQIAATMGLSIKTVEKHRRHVMEKLGIDHTPGLVRYAVESGLVSKEF